MQIFVPFLIISSVFGFHKGFHKFILAVAVLMDYVSCLKHLALDYELGRGVFLFGRFKQVYRILGLFLLFGVGFKFFYSFNFRSGLVRFLCNLRAKSRNLRNGLCSKTVLDRKCSKSSEMEKIDKSNLPTDFDGEIESDSDGELVAENNEDNGGAGVEFDVTKLRELLKAEREKLNAVRAELAKERAASATAAEEAMAMILRLQNEKSLLELESSQYRRLAEEKQIHDQEVIRSLQWLVWQHEHERSSLQPRCRQPRMKEDKDEYAHENDEDQTSFNGNILDALENVLYSSRDSNNLSS